MKQSRTHRTVSERTRAALSATLFSFASVLFAVAAADAFQSVQVETIEAGAMTGGVRPQFIKISHTALSRGSDVTKEVIILGEAGFDVPPTPPPYAQRMTIFSPEPSPENQQLEVLVEYRYVPSFQAGPEDAVQTPVIRGPDPMSFSFEINPSSVTSGTLQYRILARRLTSGTSVYAPRELEIRDPITGEVTGTEPQWYTMGVQSNALQVIGAQGGRFAIPDGNPADGETFLDIPRGLLSGPTAITLDEVPMNDPGIPPGLPEAIRMYRIDSQSTIRGNMLMTLLYPDFDYATGQDGLIDGTSISETIVGIAWWDGFTWRRLGGIVNANNNTVTAKIGTVGYFAVVPFGAGAPQDARPMEKIITPNGDGKNDVALFTFASPTDNIKVEIFDMTGHRIRTLYSSLDNGWDGKDDNGRTVESGVFIYQYRSDGKLVSGLIAVAK